LLSGLHPIDLATQIPKRIIGNITHGRCWVTGIQHLCLSLARLLSRTWESKVKAESHCGRQDVPKRLFQHDLVPSLLLLPRVEAKMHDVHWFLERVDKSFDREQSIHPRSDECK
jgi:hypothetical protein